MHRILLALLVLPAACVTVPPRPPIASQPPFVPDRFFAGRSEGTGTLRIAFRQPVSTVVHSHGHVEPDGTLILDQTVIEGSKPARTREWRIHATTPGHYAGTLTDASGPVAGDSTGNRLHLTFKMKGGLDADQKLYLAPDGQSAHNSMVIRKLGLIVASLDETIRREP